MPDFELVANLRGPRLADLSIHVRDVLALALKPEEEFETGKVAMASFDFVPYALSGLASAMVTPTAGTRPTTNVTVPIADDKGGSASVSRTVTLYGPGDVLGVDPGQIVRRYPAPGSTNAEETFHAHIEFDRPELPWAFSAHTPASRMPAWLALVVLETHEVAWEPSQTGVTPIARVNSDRLPPLDQAWAFAHGQAAAAATGSGVSISARLSTAYAAVNVSRLLGARVLSDSTDYVALLVPTTDAGVKAGLGLGEGTLQPAWIRPPAGQVGPQVRLPVYDRWNFRTAPDGDFARLARRLAFMAAPWAIGRRFLDTGSPGAPLVPFAAGEAGRRQVIRCALFSPNPAPPGAPSDTAGWTSARQADLRTVLERPAVIEGSAGVDPGAVPNLPIVGPRLYARGQVSRGTIQTTDWFAELNLAPVNRVVAGLGTRVVVKDQEPLMQAAWAQVGEIEKANRALALAELARHLAGTLHRRLEKVDDGRLLPFVRPLASRVSLDGATLTMAGQTVRSTTPPAALAGSARRALRVGGPLTRRLSADTQARAARLVTDGAAPRDFTRSYVEIDGIKGLSTASLNTLDGQALATSLHLTPDKALTAVKRASRDLTRSTPLAAALADPAIWQIVDGAELGARITARVVDRVRAAMPAEPAKDPVRARWIGGLAAGLVASRVAGTEPLREESLTLDAHVMRAASGGAAGQPSDGRRGTSVVIGGGNAGAVVTRPASAEALRGGALRGGSVAGTGGAVLRGGVGRGPGALAGGVATGPGTGGRAGIEATVSFTPTVAVNLTPAPARDVTLTGAAAGELIGSILRPSTPEGGFAAAMAQPAEERLGRMRTAQGTALGAWLEQAVTITVDQMRAELMMLVASTGALDLPRTPVRPALDVRRAEVLMRLDPGRTVVDVTRARLNLGGVQFEVFTESMIRPIMAAPRFDRPMYKALDEYDREWLVPGLGTLPEPELVTVLSTNDVFTEAFLVGLSDEMARELLWREYPTDARGTYFHRFWNPSKDELRRAIHRFGGGRLGSHVDVGPPGQSGRAVVVIRGEVVRRYPDLTVMALRQARDAQGNWAETAAGNPVLPEVPDATNAAPSLFMAPLPPDIMLAGLDITIDQLREPGWWIVLSEHPQATRFRAKGDHDSPADAQIRFAKPATAPEATGATEATARLAQPVRIAFDAADFLPAL